MNIRINRILLAFAALFAGIGTAKAAADLDLQNDLGTNATVSWYVSNTVPTATDPGTAATPGTTKVEAGQYVVVKVTPADGYWTYNEMLTMQVVGSIGGAEARPHRSVNIPVNPTALADNQADGTGFYYYQVPAGYTVANGYKKVVLAGSMAEKIDLSTATVSGTTVTASVGGWTATITLDKVSWTYDKSAHCPAISAFSLSKGTKTFTNKDEQVSISGSETNAGNHNATLSAVAGGCLKNSISVPFSIGGQAGTINFADATVSKTYGDAAFTNTLTNTGDGAVTYSIAPSSGVATVDADGQVTITGAGTATVTATVADGTNYTYATKTATYTLTVFPRTVTVSGITASSKEYDGNTTATVVTTGAVFDNKVSGDNLTVSATGTFADKNVGTGKTVTLSGLTLGGSSAANYQLAASGNQTTAKANIIAKSITVSGITASDKGYDGTTTATIVTTSAVFANLVGSDVLTISGVTGAFDDKNVGTNIIVHLDYSSATLSGTEAGNYQLDVTNSQEVDYADITAKAVTLTWSTPASFEYDGNSHQPTATVDASSLMAGDACTVSTYSLSGPTTGGKAIDAGSYTVTATALSNANYALPATGASQDFTITQTTATLAYDPVTKTYGDAAFDVVPTTKQSDGAITLSSGNTSVITVGADGKLTIVGAGQATITASQAAHGNYQAATTTFVVTVERKTVTVDGIMPDWKTYDGTTDAILYCGYVTITGMVAGDNLTVSATGTFDDKNVGDNKTVTINNIVLGGTSAGNYQLATTGNQTTATAGITPILVIVNGITADSKEYDGTTTATLDLSAVTLSNVLAGENVTLSSATGAFADKNVGTDKTVTISGLTLGGTDAGNYLTNNMNSQTTANADITAKAVTLTWSTPASFEYDGNSHQPTATVDASSLVAGDACTVSSYSLSGPTTEDKAVNVGEYTATATALSNGNYQLPATGISQTFTITQASATLVYDNVTKTYGDAAFDVTPTTNVSGGAITLSSGNTSVITVDADGKLTIVGVGQATITASQVANGNYQATTTTFVVTVGKKTVTVSGIEAKDKYYDGTTAAELVYDNVTITGMVAGDNLTVSATGTFEDHFIGMNKNVELSALTLGGTSAGNYQLAATGNQEYATANIHRCPIYVKGVTAASKVYDGTTNATLNLSAATMTGKVAGEDVYISRIVGAFADKNVGTGKTVTVTDISLDGSHAGNYYTYGDLVEVANKPDITPRSVNIVGIEAEDKVYDHSTLATLDFSNVVIDNIVSGDNLTLRGVSGAFVSPDVYRKNDNIEEIAVALDYTGATLAGTSAGNYQLAATGNQEYATATIYPKPLTVTAKPMTITYGDAPANDGVAYSDFAYKENESVLSGTLTYTYNYTLYDDVGSYTITPAGLSSNNYDISFVNGTLTVDQKEVGLSWSNISLTFSGAPQAPTATATGIVNNDVIGVTVEGAQTAVGTNYTATATALTGTKAGNYKLPATNTCLFSISAAGMQGISVSGWNGIYDGSAHSITVTAPAGATVKYRTADTGDYTLTMNPEFTDADTYTVYYQITQEGYTTVTGSATVAISPKEAVLLWADTDVDYDGNAHVPTATVDNLEVNDICTVTVSGEQTQVGNYTATATKLSNANYALPADVSTDWHIARRIDNLFADGNTWATFVPQEDLVLPAGLEAYAVSGVSGSTVSTTAAAYLASGVGLLLKRTDNSVNSFRAYAYSGTATAPESLLKGSATAATTIQSYKDYVLYNDQFLLAGVSSVGAGHAYLPATVVGGSSAPARLTIVESLTGVDAVNADAAGKDGMWYDLNGRKLDGRPVKKGLYINNGMKVVIK